MTYQERQERIDRAKDALLLAAAALVEPTKANMASAIFLAAAALTHIAAADEGKSARELAVQLIREEQARRGP